MVDFSVLPEDCVRKVLSFTTPRDVCRLTLVASTVMYTADSDPVWETFLPENYRDVVSQFQLVFSSKKELYFQLCNRPLLIDGGSKSFWLEKWSGKKCYMLAARDLYIVWGDTPLYWRWDHSHSRARESRFREVAELVSVCWLEIRGKIDTCMLSPDTTYAAYLVFESTSAMYGFEYQPLEGWVTVGGNKSETRTVYLDPAPEERQQFHIVLRQAGMLRYPTTGMVGRQASPPREPPPRESNAQYPKERGDGWFEIEFGELYNKSGEDGELELCLQEVKSGSWKSGLILEGIEIRPKEGN